MKTLLTTLLILQMSYQLHANETEWSAPVNDVRARLSLERDAHSPFLKLFMEWQNISETAGAKKIRFTPETLKLTVTDQAGTPLTNATGSYDGMSPIWAPLQLPYEGTLRCRISFPGLGYRPETDRTIIDFGPSMAWVIPEEPDYFLSGKLTVIAQPGDHHHQDWSGSLELPKILIPRN